MTSTLLVATKEYTRSRFPATLEDGDMNRWIDSHHDKPIPFRSQTVNVRGTAEATVIRDMPRNDAQVHG
jgi:hypothetical protein